MKRGRTIVKGRTLQRPPVALAPDRSLRAPIQEVTPTVRKEGGHDDKKTKLKMFFTGVKKGMGQAKKPLLRRKRRRAAAGQLLGESKLDAYGASSGDTSKSPRGIESHKYGTLKKY